MSDKRISFKFIDYTLSTDHVEYTILIKDSNNDSWAIKSRYSQLRSFHKKLIETYAQSVSLPEFPPKKVFGSKDPSFIYQRQKALENYFNNLLSNEILRNSSQLKTFLSDTPRLSSSSILRKDDTKSSSQQKLIPEKLPINEAPLNGQIKPEKITGLANTQGLNLIIESINKKLFDLGYSLNPPDEQEIKTKRMQYEKLKIDTVGLLNSSLPVGKGDNLFVAKDETLVVQNPNLINILFETTSSIRDNMNAMTDKLKNKDIIFFLQAPEHLL